MTFYFLVRIGSAMTSGRAQAGDRYVGTYAQARERMIEQRAGFGSTGPPGGDGMGVDHHASGRSGHRAPPF
jgi:hypothetical protein